MVKMKSKKLRLARLSLALVLPAVVLMVGIGLGFSGCMSIEMEPGEVERRFEAAGVEPPQQLHVPVTGGQIHLAMVKSDASLPVVFVHGSPGGWDNFVSFLADENLRRRYTLVSVDRPGFGQTLPKKAEPSLAVQAARIAEALRAVGIDQPAIFVGHSLGGPVIVRLAIDEPARVAGLVLVAPSMDPELEKRRWFNYMAKFPLVKWSLPRIWRNSNEEIYPHREELEALQPRLEEILSPTIVIQGLDDELVPPGNADYVERTFTAAATLQIWRIEGLNHFVPWRRPDLIEKAINELAETR